VRQQTHGRVLALMPHHTDGNNCESQNYEGGGGNLSGAIGADGRRSAILGQFSFDLPFGGPSTFSSGQFPFLVPFRPLLSSV
jgi:hypothetical protein